MLWLFSLFILILGVIYNQGSCAKCSFEDEFPFVVSVFFSTITILRWGEILDGFSFAILNKIKKSLLYVGNNTMTILVWHFLSFKIISYLIIGLYSLTAKRLSEFPVILEYSIKGWWILYVFVGVIIPLLFKFYYDKLRIIAR